MDIPDKTIEQLLIKKCLTNHKYLYLLSSYYDKRWIDNKHRQLIFDIILKYNKAYDKTPDLNTIKLMINKLSENSESLNKSVIIKELDIIGTLEEPANEDFIKDQIIQFIQNKAAYYAILDNIETIEAKKDVSQCIDKLQQVAGISFEDDIGFDYFKDLDQHLEEVGNPEAKLPTKFDQFDKITNGGVFKDGRCLIVGMAPTGIGKSLFLSNLAVNFMEQNLFPLIISLEMSELVYGKRIDAHISGLDINELHFDTEKVKDRILNFKNLHHGSKLLIKEFPPGSVNCNHIKTYIEGLHKSNKKPDVLLIDYINLLIPNQKNMMHENSYAKIGEIAKQMRALSYYFNIPVFSCTQTNRDGFDTSDISLDNVSESAQILHHADMIFSIYQVEGDREACRLSTKVLKNRFGGDIGKISEYYINYKTLRIQDMYKIVQQQTPTESIADQTIAEIENL